MGDEQNSFSKSESLAKKARALMPGGVNSPVRSFAYVGGTPIYVRSAKGARIKTVDGDEFIDFILGWGAIVLGHAHYAVVSEVKNALEDGTLYGLCHEKEIEFCEILRDAFPDFMFRVMNSGTEATMTAVRLARAYTRRKHIIKFSGCFHGHADQFLTVGGSGMATLSLPSSEGVPNEFTSCTITLEYNSEESVIKEVFNKYDVAGVILEVVPGNMGVLVPEKPFLDSLLRECKRNSSVMIFDEIITGFRVGWGGVSCVGKIRPMVFDSSGWREFEVEVGKPDMVTLGKIVGGGFPVGVVCASDEIMNLLSPSGPVYQAGTFSANPISLAGGLSALNFIARNKEEFYRRLRKTTRSFVKVIADWAVKKGIPTAIVAETGMFSVFFREKAPSNFEEVKSSDTNMFRRFFSFLFKRGIIIPPSPFEAWFVSISHSEDELCRFSDALSEF